MAWYNKIVKDLEQLIPFVEYYEAELKVARTEIKVNGRLEREASNLPGITEFRFNQLQEIEAVLQFLNLQLLKVRRVHFQKYLEGYARALSSRDAEKYVDGEAEVIEHEIIINEIALLRNQYLGIMKGLESKNFMLGHVVRLRTAGMEDVVIE